MNKLLTISICFALFLLGNMAQAQKNTHSTYSKYEAGLLQAKSYNGNVGMGGFGYAWRPFNYRPVIYDSLSRSSVNLNDRRSNYINPKNPASYSNLSLTVFETALFSSNTLAVSGDQTQLYNSAQLDYVALAFPLSEKWGAGFGIRPFSHRGYEYNQIAQVNNEEVEYNYEGSGGLNQLYFSTAKEFGKTLSLGVSAGYVFGTMLDKQRIIYDENSTSNFFNALDEKSRKVSDWYIETGLQYYTNISDKYRMVLGAYASPQSSLKAETIHLITSYEGEVGLEKIKDTIVNSTTPNQDVSLAPTYGGGVSIEKSGEWVVGVDYSLQSWGNYATTFENVAFTNNHNIAIGYERFNDLSTFGSYFKQMGYRLGAHYNSSIIEIEGEQIPEFGISFGVALPLRRSLTTLNLALEAGRRGVNRNQLIEENYFNIHFGVAINDRWFIRRKYD